MKRVCKREREGATVREGQREPDKFEDGWGSSGRFMTAKRVIKGWRWLEWAEDGQKELESLNMIGEGQR